MATKQITNSVGAPTKYTPEVVSKLIAGLQRDFTVEEACHYADISRDTFYKWLDRYPEFADKVEYAKTYLFRKSKEVVTDAINNGDTKTAKWYLAKRNSAYNPAQQVELSGELTTHNEDEKLLEFMKQLSGPTKEDDANTPTEEGSS